VIKDFRGFFVCFSLIAASIAALAALLASLGATIEKFAAEPTFELAFVKFFTIEIVNADSYTAVNTSVCSSTVSVSDFVVSERARES
jgi:hypothetical protein